MSASEDSATKSQIRGSSLLLAGQVFALFVNLGVQILIVRYLTQESYGAFAYALSVAMIGEAVARFGMRRGAARYMPFYEESGDPRRVAGTLVLALGTVLALGLAVVLVVAGFRGAIAGSFAGQEAAVTVLVLLVLLAPIEALGSVLDAVFAVFGRPRAVVMRKFVLTPLFRLAVVGLLLAQDEGVVFLAVGYVATGLAGLALYAPLMIRVLRERGLLARLRPGRLSVPGREVLSFTVPLLSSDITGAVMTSAGALMLGLLAAPTDVADLRAVLPVALTMGYVLTSFGLLLVPLASRMYVRGESAELNQLYWRTAIWTGVLAYPILLTCVVLAEPLTVLLFGQRYEDAAPVLALLAVGQFANTAAGNNGVMLGVFRKVRFVVLTNLVALVFIFALLVALIPPFDAAGAAAATSLTLLVVNVIRQVGLARYTSIHGFVPEAWGPYAGMAAAAAVVIGVQFALSPPTPVSIVLVAVASAAVLALARHAMALAESFPELARLPLVGRLVGARPGP